MPSHQACWVKSQQERHHAITTNHRANTKLKLPPHKAPLPPLAPATPPLSLQEWLGLKGVCTHISAPKKDPRIKVPPQICSFWKAREGYIFFFRSVFNIFLFLLKRGFGPVFFFFGFLREKKSPSEVSLHNKFNFFFFYFVFSRIFRFFFLKNA